MADDSSMTAAVLEALGNICLDAEQTASIVETVRGFLSAAQPADLPVVLRYEIVDRMYVCPWLFSSCMHVAIYVHSVYTNSRVTSGT